MADGLANDGHIVQLFNLLSHTSDLPPRFRALIFQDNIDISNLRFIRS